MSNNPLAASRIATSFTREEVPPITRQALWTPKARTAVWLARGGTAANGIVYGSPDKAVPWGTAGCPLLPRMLREHLGAQKIPAALAQTLGLASPLAVADLDAKIWQQLAHDELPLASHKGLLIDFAHSFPQMPRATALAAGLSLAWLAALPLRGRLHHLLRQLQLGRGADGFLERTIVCEDILSVPNMGLISLLRLLCVLESAEVGRISAADAPEARMRTHPDVNDAPDAGRISAADAPEARMAIESEGAKPNPLADAPRTREKRWAALLYGNPLQNHASWALAETDAQTLGQAVAHALAEESPVETWHALAAVPLKDIAVRSERPYAILDRWVAGLNEREQRIFALRLTQEQDRATLQALATEMGVTRERIRQLEAQLLDRLHSLLARPQGTPLRWRLETLKRRLGVAAPWVEVEKLLLPEDGQTDYAFFMLRLAGPYVRAGDWLVLQAAVATDPTRAICQAADEIGRIDPEWAMRKLRAWGLRGDLCDRWLMRKGTVRKVKGHLVKWDGSIGDKLVLALFELGRPATVDALLRHLQTGRTRNTALNAMSQDPRLVRINRTEWALASWSLPVYENISASIRKMLEAAGQPMRMEDIAQRLWQDFGTPKSSALTYCQQAGMFIQEQGWVRLRKESESFSLDPVSLRHRKAQGVFALSPHRVALLFEVNADMLRGSGRPLAHAAAQILQLSLNERLIFRTRAGLPLTVTFPDTSIIGPTLGSVKNLAEEVGAQPGHQLTLILDRHAKSVLARTTAVAQHASGWELVSQLTGMPAQAQWQGLAAALQCQPDEVRAVLRARGDAVILNAIPESSRPSDLETPLFAP